MSTSTATKERYNEKTYQNLRIRVRKDSPISGRLKEYTKRGELNALVNKLLESYFDSTAK
jgi:hypothetical protein